MIVMREWSSKQLMRQTCYFSLLCTLFYIQELMKLVTTKKAVTLHGVIMAATAVQSSSDLPDSLKVSDVAHTSSPAAS